MFGHWLIKKELLARNIWHSGKHMQRFFNHSNLPLEFKCNGKQDTTI
jgi:hypothetical protein